MSAPPPPPDPDDKDWTWVLERPCPDCGYDAAGVPLEQVPHRIPDAVGVLEQALDRPGATDRPAPAVWSPLEYACHVRDVCRIFTVRVALIRDQDDPQFANWDQDATAIDERYWTQDPTVVAAELKLAAEQLADALRTVDAAEWSRPGRRSNGSVFTLQTLALYLLHDLVHHAHDVVANAA